MEGTVVLRDLPDTLSLPGGGWPEAAHTACVLPLVRAGNDAVRGWLVVGASPRLAFVALYQSFFELLARGLADALSNACAYEDELRRAESLAVLDRDKTGFFCNVSHEFRTPMTLLLGPVEDLLSENRLSEPDRAQLALVHRNSLRLLKLVNTMLDFSRIEAGRIAANFEPVRGCGSTTLGLRACVSRPDSARRRVSGCCGCIAAVRRMRCRFKSACDSMYPQRSIGG
ncbi:MAG: hypothetical protein IIZ92_17630 [Aquincola sp.]|nr:hypothetical protein [Aquincola sp.]